MRMEAIRTQRNRLKLKPSKMEAIKAMSLVCTKLYNEALYSVRQYYFQNGEYLNYASNYHRVKTSANYQMLLSDIAQSVVRLVDRDMRSFFGLLKLKSQGKYSDKIHLPSYKKDRKSGEALYMSVPIQGRSARIKDGYVVVSIKPSLAKEFGLKIKELRFKLPKHMKHIKKLQELRFVPSFGGKVWHIEFVYKIALQEPKQKGSYLAIDFGIDNFATCYPSGGGAFIIDGRYIKSINRYFNKRKAFLQSIYDRQGYKNTNNLIALSRRRDNRINNFFNLAVKYIVKYALKHNIATIVMGDFSGSKQSINIGKANNQNFVSIPFYKFKQKLASKCEEFGIQVVHQDESYTSKASFLDRDDMPLSYDSKINYQGSGKRIKRGLYRSAQGYLLNADVNGAANILVKYFKSNGLHKELEALYATRYGCVNHPKRLRLSDLAA